MRVIKIINNLLLRRATPKKRAIILKTKYHLNIGSDCEVYEDVSFGSEPYLISIGNNVRLAKGVKLTTHDGGMWVVRKLKNKEGLGIFKPIKIGSNVHVGIDTIIMPGIEIGDNVIIGAGSIVTKNVPSNTVVAGVPARIIRDIESYMEKHESEMLDVSNLSTREMREILSRKVER